jgi:hypothetical protein
MDVNYDSPGFSRGEANALSPRYWIVACVLLLWGLGYALLIAEALFIMRPEDFDRLVSAGMILPGYGDYVQHLPQWIVGLTLFKGFTRLAGAVGLLLRRRWAVSMYSLSLAVSCVIFFRGFLLDNRGSFEAPTQIGLDVVFFCASVFAVYFALASRFRGVLR